MIGNVLEWYDFAIYGYFATQIGRNFFPHEDAVAQLLSAFGVFAIGYLMRPIGGVIVGHIGDRFGRRAALTFSVTAMAIPTFLIGLLPGYQTIGLLAPIGLTLLRIVQGLSVGGEYTSSMVFLIERAPEGRRGLMGALAASGSALGILLGSAVGAALAASMSTAALDTWGWRIPFLLGLVVGITGYMLRRYVLEAGVVEKRTRLPIIETLHDHWRAVAGFAGLSVYTAVTFYVGFVYLVSWLQTADGIPPSRSLEINTFGMVMMLPVVITAGWLSDWIGRKLLPRRFHGHLLEAPGSSQGLSLLGHDALRAGRASCPAWRNASWFRAFLDKLSDERLCDLRVVEYTASANSGALTAAVATSREGHRMLRSGRANRPRRWGRGRQLG